MPCSEPRDPAYFQHLSNGERKGTFRNGHSRAHYVRTRHGLSDSHDFRIFSSMPFLGDPKCREAEFFTRGMMGRKQTACKKGRNGSLDTAPLPATSHTRENLQKPLGKAAWKPQMRGPTTCLSNTDVKFTTIVLSHRTSGQIWQGPGLGQRWQRYLKRNYVSF